jgi:hypothetical protein
MGMIRPSLEEVRKLAVRGNVIPVHREMLGDLWTPAAAYLRIAHGRRRVFLLESVEGGGTRCPLLLRRLGSVHPAALRRRLPLA